jgi:hypothetical protein
MDAARDGGECRKDGRRNDRFWKMIHKGNFVDSDQFWCALHKLTLLKLNQKSGAARHFANSL